MSQPILPKSRAKKGVDPAVIYKGAFQLLVDEGEVGFSIRRLAARLELDPMSVLHHGQSRDALLRAAADRLLAELSIPDATLNWRATLLMIANGFRGLALRYPRAFPVLVRFHATGPADYRLGESVYGAMRAAGLAEQEAAEFGLAFYAIIIGLAFSEVAGMLQPAQGDEVNEIAALPESRHTVTRALLPAFTKLDNERLFTRAINAYLDGLADFTTGQTRS